MSDGTGGTGASWSEAAVAAIGEAVERYSGAFVPEERVVLASARELGPAAVPPERFALFAAWQYAKAGFPFRRFTRDTVVGWVQGFALPDGDEAYLPAQLVYLGDPRGRPGETPIGYATSNGLACGPTLEEAVLSALLEAVERDAFMLAWYGSLSLPQLDWASDPDLSAYDERTFRPTGLRYAAIDLSVFLDVPVVLAVVRNAGSEPSPLAVGAGCAPSVGAAWKKALSEAFAVRAWARSLVLEQPDRRFRPDGADVRTFADHVHFYADAERARAGTFLDAATERRSVREIPSLEGPDVAALVRATCDRLARSGERAYAVDVTSPDIADAGLNVAKVLAPGLCQLDVSHSWRYLGGDRLVHAAHRLGLRHRPLAASEVNPFPHPFP
jgi:ribosomal protein S12 methylthiotransferase accessory factor